MIVTLFCTQCGFRVEAAYTGNSLSGDRDLLYHYTCLRRGHQLSMTTSDPGRVEVVR